jgi:nucleoside triphosphatase
MSEKNNYAVLVVGVLIYNQKNQVLLIKNLKYLDLWSIPSGKVNKGEKVEEAVKREIKEETGLEIDNIEFISIENSIDYKFFPKDKHFVLLNYMARESGGKLKKSQELIDFIWIDPKEALKRDNISDTVISPLQKFIKLLNKKEDLDEDYKTKYQRALADKQNYIKKSEEERQEFVKYALANFIQDIIPVYDHLKLSIKGLPESEKNNAWVIGVNHTLRQFKELLKSKGVEEIETKDKNFDHNTMEVIKGEGEKVIKEVSCGYTLNGRLLKPAKVIVGK